jgi:3',5'-cyclic AMP phosphodiesterase CpdA
MAVRHRARTRAGLSAAVAALALVASPLTSDTAPANAQPTPAGQGGTATSTGTAATGATSAAPRLARRPLVRLAAAGDIGTGEAPERRTVAAMVDASRHYHYTAVPLLGDLVYPSGNPRQVRRKVLRPFAPVTRQGAMLVPALGNHDYLMGRPDAIMRRLGRAHRHYVERAGPVRIVVLDSNRVTARETRWLRRTLRHDPAGVRWTIPIMHHPAYSAGVHGSDITVRRAWSPLFARFDVPLVLAGHDHDYQRSRRIRGVTYVVSGGGAETRPTGRAWFTAVSRSVLHFVDLAVYRDRILVRAVRQNGRVFDRFTLRR